MRKLATELPVVIRTAELAFANARASYILTVFAAVDRATEADEIIAADDFRKALETAKLLWPSASEFNKDIAEQAGRSTTIVNSWAPTKEGSRVVVPDKFTRSGVMKIVSKLVKERLNGHCPS
jgi:hypothetical protein